VPQIEDLSAFTGLSIEEFNRLYPMIADRYGDYEIRVMMSSGFDLNGFVA
jgi:hypothetical protein